jgi:hypothetical protein
MPGKRNARSRVRGSWAARLTGTAFAVVLAGAGVAAYLTLGGAHDDNSASVLPTRVLGTQAIGLADSAPAPSAGASPVTETLLMTRSGLGFQDSGQSTTADWTADQMAGGTYIFIYLPNGLCLGSSRANAVSLQRCNLQAGQRWIREHPVLGASGLDYWQLRNLAAGRCLTAESAAGGSGASVSAPRLERCQASPRSSQLIAFLVNT